MGKHALRVTFGKHRGKSLELLFLKEPGYVAWVCDQEKASAPLARLQDVACQLRRVFDRKPLLKPCLRCGGQAVRFSYYLNGTGLMFWCDTCNPYSSGAAPGRLAIGQRYEELVDRVRAASTGPNTDLKSLVLELARAKGLPSRVGESQAAAFFEG